MRTDVNQREIWEWSDHTQAHKPASPTWKAFLTNHVHDIVACDFFTVPTVTFRVLFVFVMALHRKCRLHTNGRVCTKSRWVILEEITI
jgi:putative transposase